MVDNYGNVIFDQEQPITSNCASPSPPCRPAQLHPAASPSPAAQTSSASLTSPGPQTSSASPPSPPQCPAAPSRPAAQRSSAPQTSPVPLNSSAPTDLTSIRLRLTSTGAGGWAVQHAQPTVLPLHLSHQPTVPPLHLSLQADDAWTVSTPTGGLPAALNFSVSVLLQQDR